jgi:NAD(P)-dependent dehydrogenase (short-subunit alcohol dehydrogenase family)
MTQRVAIVTGAAQGIGRAFARRFAADGYRIVVADQNAEKGAATAKEIAGTGAEATFIHTDVTGEASCKAMAEGAMRAFGRIDVLINNAGLVNVPRANIWELEVAEWDRIMNVNARGVWLVTKVVVPGMRASGGGSIINISSNTFLSGRAGVVHYVASKGAVIGITRTAARELGEFNIRVNAIMPGSTITDERRERGYDAARAQFLVDSQAIKHEETPDDLIGVAAFLASEDARFITGQSINVDGGFLFH